MSVICVLICLVMIGIISIFLFLSRGLDTCEATNGIVYGDLAPANIAAVGLCRLQHTDPDCMCMSESLSLENKEWYQNDDTGLSACFSFNLVHDKTNCEQVLGAYPDALAKLQTSLWILFTYACCFSFVLCGKALGCCPGPTSLIAASPPAVDRGVEMHPIVLDSGAQAKSHPSMPVAGGYSADTSRHEQWRSDNVGYDQPQYWSPALTAVPVATPVINQPTVPASDNKSNEMNI